MANKDKGNSGMAVKMDNETLLKTFVEKFGYGPIIEDALGELAPSMTYSEFNKLLADKGIDDVVNDMTLGELFGLKEKKTESKVVKEKVMATLKSGGKFSVKEIAEKIDEDAKQVGICLSALKKAGEVIAEGEKRSTKYTTAPATTKN